MSLTDGRAPAAAGARRLSGAAPPPPAGRWPARVAALATVAGGAWHAGMAVHLGGAVAVVLLLMAAVCAACAVELWSRPACMRAWVTVLAMDAAMVLIHAVLLASEGHMHAGAAGWLWGPDAMVVVPLASLLVTCGAAYRTYRAVVLASG